MVRGDRAPSGKPAATDGDTADLDFRVLGPLEVRRGAEPVLVKAPLQRVVLATLLLEGGRPVGLDRLIEVLWARSAPRTARVTVQNYVHRLRRLLDAAGTAAERSVIGTSPGGYLLRIDPGQVDVFRFHDRLRRARAATAGPDVEEAAALYRAALDEWRDDPLPELSDAGWLQAERARLADLHVTATEEWIGLELVAGRAVQVIEPLTVLVDRWPLRESARAMLVRALHACGRTGDALAEFRRARQILIDELGVEPGAALVAAHREALHSGDVRLEGGADAGTSVRGRGASPAVTPIPAHLPPGLAWFAGRQRELALLDASLPAHASAGAAVVTVSGSAGVGKTALVIHWAHLVAGRFPGGQLYVNLRGFDPGRPAMGPAEAVRGFLAALGVAQRRVPQELDAQVGLYRSLLAGRRMLVVLDNARGAEQVRPLLPGAPGCLAVVTSRNQLTALVVADGARRLHLGLLTDSEARGLLDRRLGLARTAAEPEAATAIVRRCARLPLALAIATARVVSEPRLSLAAVADRLGEGESALDLLRTGDPASDVRSVFSWSIRAIDPDAARLFRLLGLHPGPDITVAAAASLAGIPAEPASRLLAELARASLLTEHETGRYDAHDLLRAYAHTLAEDTEALPDRLAAMGRLLDHYLHSAYAAAGILHTTRPRLTLAPARPGALVEVLAGREQALAWLDAERTVLLAAIDLAASTPGFEGHTWRLARVLTGYLFDGYRAQELLAMNRVALAVAERSADLLGRAHIHHGLAQAFAWLRRYHDGFTHVDRALDLFVELGDRHGQGRAHGLLGYLLDRHGAFAAATFHTEQALTLYRATGDRAHEASALNNVGWYRAKLGDHDGAVEACLRALDIHQELGDRDSESSTWDSLGYAYLQLGRHPEAIECFVKAIDLAESLGQPLLLAESLTNLGDTYRATGNPAAARSEWVHALRILEDLDHPDAEQVRSRLDLPGPGSG